MTQEIEILTQNVREHGGFIQDIFREMERVVVGQTYLMERLVLSLLTGEHVLVEGVPGLAKTTAVKTLAQTIHASFKRIQFTPDLLPADLIGTQIYQPRTEEFVVKKGPVFANIILADEINRTTPRTQSGLLECMQEYAATVDGTTHKLPEPFFVIATENPIESYGTYPLPEAQLDRFLMKFGMGYISQTEDNFTVIMGFSPDLTFQHQGPTLFGLRNDGDEVLLLDDSGQVVDCLVYGDSEYNGDGWTGPPVPGVYSGKILERQGMQDTNTSWTGLLHLSSPSARAGLKW